MSPNNERSWINRLLSMGIRHDQMSSVLGQSGSLQQEAYVRQILKETKQKRLDFQTPLDAITFIILDTETTGFNAEEDAIFSFSATQVKAGAELSTLSTLINPERSIPKVVVELTQVDEVAVNQAPVMDDMIHRVLDFLANGILVGYHITHDLNFLNAYLRKSNLKKLPHQSFELRQLMERLYHKPFPTLDDALNFLDIPSIERHSADGDVRVMCMIWDILYDKFKAQNLVTLYDLYNLVG